MNERREINNFEIMNDRLYGIDLLRVIAMLFVMILHVLGHGGILDNVESFSINYSLGWLLEIIAFCAVDCFVIISGYVGINSKFKYSNLGVLWIETILYSTLLFFSIGVYNNGFSFKGMITCIFPIITTQYWFFSAYIGMMIVSPIINAAVLNTENKKLYITIIIATAFFSVASTINGNVFDINAGRCTLWFIILYMMGATLKKGRILKQTKSVFLLMILVALVLITWISKIGLDYGTYRILGKARFGNILVKYSSPVILVIALIFVEVFSRLSIRQNVIQVLKVITPLVFSAYLIQDNAYFRSQFVTDKFIFVAEVSPVLMLFIVLGSSILFMIGAFVIDYLRNKIFNLFQIKKKLNGLEEKMLVFKNIN